jgi:2-polyprenyl-3-methyl-5-hydroxy-6-metoxy-1,4-benzoquinol methylase
VTLATTNPECTACGALSTRRLWNLRFESYPGPFPLWRCDRCGIAFNWPQLPPASIHGQYDAGYYIFTLPPKRRWARATQLYLEYLHPLEGTNGQRLLDVGCAQGDLLALARERGWDVQGIELSPEPARRARLEHGIPVEIGTLEETGPGLGLFDVVIATDVIEHVTSPGRFLGAVHTVLRTGGQAIVETPNFGGFWSKMGGARWIGLNRFHIFLFAAAGLVRLMRASGFHSCRASSCTHTAHAHWGDRPELGNFIRPLPAALRWRVQRELNKLTPSSLGAELWQDPPRTMEEALDKIARTAPHRGRTRRLASLAGDNLCVTGVAGVAETGGRHAS